jgi:hypothetical protein
VGRVPVINARQTCRVPGKCRAEPRDTSSFGPGGQGGQLPIDRAAAAPSSIVSATRFYARAYASRVWSSKLAPRTAARGVEERGADRAVVGGAHSVASVRGPSSPLLVSSDGAAGIISAIEQVYPKTLCQRCLIPGPGTSWPRSRPAPGETSCLTRAGPGFPRLARADHDPGRPAAAPGPAPLAARTTPPAPDTHRRPGPRQRAA